MKMVGEAALARISCLWLKCHAQQKIVGEQLRRNNSGCAIEADQLTGVIVDIRVY